MITERRAIISYDLVEAWEVAGITIIDKDAPNPVTSEWLTQNPDGWEFEYVKDSGSSSMTGFVVEEEF